MQQYLDVLKKVLENGTDIEGRNGGTRKIFTEQMRFKMSDGFPAVTTKRLAFRSMAAELFWFMSGYSDNNELNRLGCKIWDGNANADYWKPKAKFDGDLGRVYGVQWRNWTGPDGKVFDQLHDVIERIKTNPNDRRLIVSAWNPAELDQMALPPCHMMFQFFVADGKLSLHMFQRSCDMFLGVPFNIASYALLLHIVAQMTGTEADELILTLGDAHIYHDHLDAVREQITRTPGKLPTLWLNPEIMNLEDLDTKKLSEPNDIYTLVKLVDYNPQKTIKAKMSV
ncbi:MAG: thymidylate synthase [Candidatus Pacebacteria bacterium]|nr:thymidylate synthase [Candidatus Paceibacterota bacterium]